MKTDVQHWSAPHFGRLFDNDIAVKILSSCKYLLELYEKISVFCIESPPKAVNNVIQFNKKTPSLFRWNDMRNHNSIKIITTGISIILCVVMLSMLFNSPEKSPANYITIEVRGGDTVWSIASQHAANKEDIRELVYTIKALNGLNPNGSIYSGQILKVPAPAKYSMESLDTLPQ